MVENHHLHELRKRHLTALVKYNKSRVREKNIMALSLLQNCAKTHERQGERERESERGREKERERERARARERGTDLMLLPDLLDLNQLETHEAKKGVSLSHAFNLKRGRHPTPAINSLRVHKLPVGTNTPTPALHSPNMYKPASHRES